MATRNQAFDSPNSTVAVDADGNLTTAYLTWVSRMTIIGQTIQQSGVTADRPIEVLWIGRQFYDTTLNKPVYVSAVKPTVWRDAAGAIV